MTDVQVLAGWKVHPRGANPAQITELASHLAGVAAILPGPVLSIVQRAKIYVHTQSEWEEKEDVMAFHWSAEYLMKHGRNSHDSAVEGSIEIHNISCLLSILRAWPGSLVHELGHAFHYRLSCDADRAIEAAFEKSRDLPCYQQSYAVENRHDPLNFYKEYWACLFASYFNSNNCRPFNREELRTDDLVGFALVHRLIANS